MFTRWVDCSREEEWDCSRDGLVVSRFKRRESKVGEKGIAGEEQREKETERKKESQEKN